MDFETFRQTKDEDELKQYLSQELKGRNIRNESGSASILGVKVNYNIGEKPHPHKILHKVVYPDLVVFHTGLDLKWRKLSNPFYLEITLSESYESINQIIPYKYLRSENVFEKYGDFHVAFANLSLLKNGVFEKIRMNRDLDITYDYDFWLTRFFWALGFGIMRKLPTDARICMRATRSIREQSLFLIEFNEEEFILID